MKLKNIVVSGCSFSADALGGLPPTKDYSGGNSFREDPDYTTSVPTTWASFLAKIAMETAIIQIEIHFLGGSI